MIVLRESAVFYSRLRQKKQTSSNCGRRLAGSNQQYAHVNVFFVIML